ncbi:helix-turn-helix domain-containing protein [Marinobacter sp. 2_MG-2023]|uniref:helix-turn-helix domain-containing protein n=1 Tax=Marinobacter sp. 2_MG-2023 TaxID=3062679 RepID=UPI0026E38A9B|nr:AraC family transcriptional regulator [Marinobacter sp. 2_MG-2023]MDO6441378.1 AraC family transcriptional regulator [Marinobacter sp. 2_MG-2023]
MAPSGEAWQSLEVPTWVCPKKVFDLKLAESSQLFIMKPAHQYSAVMPSTGTHQLLAIAPLLKRYLENIKFYVDHAHAKALTRELFSQLAKCQAGGQLADVPGAEPTDWRLLRTIEKIEQNPSWEFNLQELASYSGASERNLYYLMKHNTGMTPYRFYQRQRLIRVRRRLVDCQIGEPHISRHAADEGFSHLGRFSALYREHFGELPSKTVRGRQRFCSSEVEACEEVEQG